MTTFDKREEGFEKKFALDEEKKFKAEARRNRLLGLWAAEKLGMTGDAAATYAKEVVASDFEEAGDGDVVRKVLGDLAAKGVAMTEPQLRVKMDELMAAAVAQLQVGNVVPSLVAGTASGKPDQPFLFPPADFDLAVPILRCGFGAL